jgi:hypothetical protein
MRDRRTLFQVTLVFALVSGSPGRVLGVNGTHAAPSHPSGLFAASGAFPAPVDPASIAAIRALLADPDPPIEFQFDKRAATRKALESLSEENRKVQTAEHLQFAAIRIAEANGDECAHAGKYLVIHFASLDYRSGPNFQVFEVSSPDAWKDTGFLTAPSMAEAVRLFRDGIFCE